MPRTDAELKATGSIIYAGDVALPGMAFVAVARSAMPHCRSSKVSIQRLRRPARASSGSSPRTTSTRRHTAEPSRMFQSLPKARSDLSGSASPLSSLRRACKRRQPRRSSRSITSLSSQ